MRRLVIIFSLLCLLFLSGCGIFFDSSNGWEENVQVKIGGIVLDPIQPEEEIKLTCKVEWVDEKEPIFYSWSADGGEFNTNDEKEVKWTAPSSSGLTTIKVEVKDDDGNSVQDDFSFIVGDVDGLIFEHKLVVEENTSNRPRMEVIIRNIKDDKIRLDVNGTAYISAYYEEYEKGKELFNLIKYDTIHARSSEDEKIPFTRETRIFNRCDNELPLTFTKYFFIDTLEFSTNNSGFLLLEFEIASILDKIEGFGGTPMDPDNPERLLDYWAGYLEWIILRPADLQPGDIKQNELVIDLPSGWDYAVSYPEKTDGVVELGDLKFMSWKNDLQWKNIQRGNLVIFNKGPFQVEKGHAGNLLIQNVFHENYHGEINNKANFTFYSFLTDYIGELPVENVVTFSHTYGRKDELEYFEGWQTAPWRYGYSIMGNYFASSSGGLPPGQEGYPKWEFEGDFFLTTAHNVIRAWKGSMPGSWAAIYLEELAFASKFSQDEFYEKRLRPMYEFYKKKVVVNGKEEDVFRSTGHSFLGYFKWQTLVPFYFDQLIQEATDGKKDLSNAIQKIYQETLSGAKEGGMMKEITINALNKASKGKVDFQEKFYAYKPPGKILDLDEYLY